MIIDCIVVQGGTPAVDAATAAGRRVLKSKDDQSTAAEKQPWRKGDGRKGGKVGRPEVAKSALGPPAKNAKLQAAIDAAAVGEKRKAPEEGGKRSKRKSSAPVAETGAASEDEEEEADEEEGEEAAEDEDLEDEGGDGPGLGWSKGRTLSARRKKNISKGMKGQAPLTIVQKQEGGIVIDDRYITCVCIYTY